MSDQPAVPGDDSNPGNGVDPAEVDGEDVPSRDLDAETVKSEALSPEALLQSLRDQLTETEQRLVASRDQHLRKAAELENVRRRLTKQLDDHKQYAGTETAREMLPVLDDLELAMEHAKGADGENAAETILDGMALVQRKFVAVLERYGIRPFESIGEPFDPKIHEAISQQTTDAYPDGHVAGEYLKGYMIHDRLLRPALVIVARSASSEAPEA